MKSPATAIMEVKLTLRSAEGTIRNLQNNKTLYDFSSNDYLGFSRAEELQDLIREEVEKHAPILLGATGSRLLSGNSPLAEDLEKEIATVHQATNGLIFNSGYAANTSLFSCLPQKGDTIIHDEYIHASVIDGARLSFAHRFKFKHNDLEDLERKIKQSKGICYVAVESVYSMDGDLADLLHIALLCRQYGAQLIVDEAHAFGVFGTGLVDLLAIHEAVFARVVTFGKALGLHGAIVLGSNLLRNYLINFARPFIYSTALPPAHLLAIKVAYAFLLDQQELRTVLKQKCELLKDNLPPKEQLHSSNNPSAIQCIYLHNNKNALQYSNFLLEKGFDVRAIRSPTVPAGTERLRICVHVHNTDREILELCHYLHQLSKVS